MNKFRDLFTKDYTSHMRELVLNNIRAQACWTCIYDKDLSDDRNTYHECQFGIERDDCQMCALWQLNDSLKEEYDIK